MGQFVGDANIFHVHLKVFGLVSVPTLRLDRLSHLAQESDRFDQVEIFRRIA